MGSDSDDEYPAPRPPDVPRLPLASVADDIAKIGELLPDFPKAFNGQDFISLAGRIHGSFHTSDSAVVTPLRLGAPSESVGDRVVSVEDGRMSGERGSVDNSGARVSAQPGFTSDATEAAAGKGLGFVVATEGRVPVTGTASSVDGGSECMGLMGQDGGSRSSPMVSPALIETAPMARLASVRATPDISRVRRFPVRGYFRPSNAVLHDDQDVSMGITGAGQSPADLHIVPEAVTSKPVCSEAPNSVLGGSSGATGKGLPSGGINFPDSIRFGSLDFKISSNDTFASSFLQSNRTCCHYVEPEIVDGQAIVRPAWSVVEKGRARWNSVLVGYFLGRKLPFFDVKRFIASIWKGVVSVKATTT